MNIVYGFELIKDQIIQELNTKARLYRHLSTGAELLSLENSDENKVFGITFRTPPANSTGVPHIMEHAVLSGSRRYPLKEPFVELVKGSLNTFLNAMTYPDKTCYPVASQNLQDFYNLIDVYMDAVLYPLIPEHTFQQEGWHFELEDLNSPLSYKGVVFNEMKGAYSSPDNILGRFAQRSLFPDTPYSFDSGGDPQSIPDLTYQQFKAFHNAYYHPSNARIFFYGDDDPDERLRRMAGYIKDFAAAKIDSTIDLQPRWEQSSKRSDKRSDDQPRRHLIPYDAGQQKDGQKGMLAVNWLLTDTMDPETTLGLGILAYILIGTPASPLRKALIDSGLGEDLAGAGFRPDIRQMFFSTGLKGISDGVERSDASPAYDQVESLILATLEQLARDGIDSQTVAAAVNTTEFRLRENNTGAFPRGLSLMLRALNTWLYDGDPFAPLSFEAPMAAIKQRLEKGERYFETQIQEYLLDNFHRTTVILQPEAGLRQRQEASEQERLAAIRAALTQNALQSLVENTRQLKLRQETPDPPELLAILPSLKLSDLDRQNKLIPIEKSTLAGIPVLYHDLFTNGILYIDLGFNLHVLPQEYLPYLPLFGQALFEMGTESEDFVQLSQRIGRDTGGIYPVEIISARNGVKESAAWLVLRGKSILSRATDLLSILKDVLTTVRLDNQSRFYQMVLEQKAGMEAMLVPAGHQVVNTRLRAQFGEAGWANEQAHGISNLFFLRQLDKQAQHDWPAVLEKLESIRSLLLNRQGMICNVTLDAAGLSQFQPQLADFLAGFPTAPLELVSWRPTGAKTHEGLTIPTQVNYVGKGAELYRLGYLPDGSHMVITNYLRTTWLWEKVRVQGGAYGGFCLFDQRSGVFTYLSYRDPNLLNTLDNFDQTASFLRQLDQTRLSQEELTKSIIGAIGDLDAYQLPDAKGYTSLIRYLVGESDADRQQRREQVLETNLEDFHAFGAVLDKVIQAGHVVVLGSEEAISSANAGRGGWLHVQKVL
jgi:Zn-dependent M16 (insulinase) family peptidase